jgi:Cysteine rich repeat
MKRVAVLAAMTLALSSGCAFAVSEAVKNACTSDFAAYCSQHKVGTEAARACMREHRKMLTNECIQALGHSSEVTQADIDLYKREHNQ